MRPVLLAVAALLAVPALLARPLEADVPLDPIDGSVAVATPGPTPVSESTEAEVPAPRATVTSVPAGVPRAAGARAAAGGIAADGPGVGASGAAVGDAPVLLVYLPAVANQNPQEVASAVTALAAHLGAALSAPGLEVSFFRRAEDALSFGRTERSRVAFVLCEAPFLLDLAADHELVPFLRFVSGGSPTERKLLVVRAGGARRLADLKGKALAAVTVPARGFPAHLSRVLDGLLPAGWFGKVEATQDELAATAAVLYGTADAALVSEHNPLAASKLGGELRALYSSPPLSLPVLAARRSRLTGGLEEALLKAAAELPRSSDGPAILSGLRIDRLSPIPEGPERSDLLKPPARAPRQLEVAIPDPALLPAVPPARLDPADLPFLVTLDIPSIPLTGDGSAP